MSRLSTWLHHKVILTLALLAAGLISACGNNDTTNDTVNHDALADTQVNDSVSDAQNDSIPGDTASDTSKDLAPDQIPNDVPADLNDDDQTENDAVDPYVFDIRQPLSEAKECVAEGSYMMAQMDHICVIDNTALNALIYVQANPESCDGLGNPQYSIPGAWIKVDDTITPISAAYDFGGRHHHDRIYFHIGTTKYVISHSSIGFGWRPCNPPDCLIVCEEGVDCTSESLSGILQNGCERDACSPPPALQVICVQVNPNGTVPELSDPWATPNPWDETAFILPCAGECVEE